MSPWPQVGFVGLGQIGAPMAGHLVDWPGGLVVCDVRAEATAPLAEQGAAVAATPAELAGSADLISVMVRDDAQVEQVVGDRGGIVDGVLDTGRSGIVVAVHSTIRPGTAESLAELCAPHGIAVVDAPVSGGFVGAQEARLAVLVGGDDAAVERCRAPFGRWADLFVHLGPVGAGTRGKLARNLLHFVAFTAAAEAQRLAEASGISLKRLARVVRHSDAVTGGPGAIMLRSSAGPLAPDEEWHDAMLHVRALGEKDLALALDLGEQLAVDLPLARLALEHLAAGLGVPHEAGGGSQDGPADQPSDEQREDES